MQLLNYQSKSPTQNLKQREDEVKVNPPYKSYYVIFRHGTQPFRGCYSLGSLRGCFHGIDVEE